MERGNALLVTLVVALFGCLVALYSLCSFDEPLQSIDDLEPPALSQVEFKDDGLPLLRGAYAAVDLPEDTSWFQVQWCLEDPTLFASTEENPELTEQRARELLKNNEHVVVRIRSALDKASLQFPVPASLDDPTPWMSELKSLFEYLCASSMAALKDGDFDTATRFAFDGVRLGERGIAESTSGPGCLFGKAFLELSLRLIRNIARDSRITPAQLKILADRLDQAFDPRPGFRRAVLFDHRLLRKTYTEMNAKEFGRHFVELPMLQRLLFRVFYQPQRTKNMLAAEFRFIASEFDNETLPARTPMPKERYHTWLEPNPLGRIVLDLLSPAYRRTIDKCYELAANRALTRVLIALRAYEIDKGGIPFRLADLVPDYLPRVPIDACDGKELRYLHLQRLIYSVGEDHLDDSGDADTKKDEVISLDKEIE